MADTLPELTETIDDAFLHTWYDIRKEAIDNILDATPVWAALKERGCLKTQKGGRFIERTIKYGTKSTTEVAKGSVFSQGEDEIETGAFWSWKYISAHVQRSVFDDQVNSGENAIKKLVDTKLTAAKDALIAKLETVLFGAYSATADTTDKSVQGLNELVPNWAYGSGGSSFAVPGTLTYGKISRGNSWWESNYKAMTANPEVNLLSDMKNLYNTCSKNIASPNLIVTTQEWFELYEDFALEISQIVKDESTHLADLGFDVLRFKGKPMVWTDSSLYSTYQQMLMLNTDFIEVVYDPQLWFAMSNWKEIPLQGERIAHFLNACNVIGTQPRRQGRLYETA